MKTNKWIVRTMIALLVLTAMGAFTYNALAQNASDDGDDSSESNSVALQSQAGITQEEANAIALAQFPGAKIIESELEMEKGTLIYSFDMENGQEVELNANTGAVLPSEAEADSEFGD
jgi:uncharacterized membrane protein YkoI